MYAISNTDIKWAEFLKKNQLCSKVNFWTPTPWNVKQLAIGDRFYFLLKSPIRKIGGYGSFCSYMTMTVYEAWDQFGIRNGCESKKEFIERLSQFGEPGLTTQIGCIILDDVCFFDTPVSLEEYQVSFPPQVVKLKYYYDEAPFADYEPLTVKDTFSLVEQTDKEKKSQLVSERKGQGKFRQEIARAYNHKCCISGEQTPELLQAAHIQGYINESSNNIQNGLYLRIDLHKMFDSGLLSIDENYRVHISSKVSSSDYFSYDGQLITLPDDPNKRPSLLAIQEKQKEFRP